MIGDLTAATIEITGTDGHPVQAYQARPSDPGPRGGVVVIHHLPGYDEPSKEITRRFAALGYDAIMPNLYCRQAPGRTADEAATLVRNQGGIADEQLVGDVNAAAKHLRELDSSNGKVGVIGFCSGGRQSVLAAIEIDLDAAVDCYGAFAVGTPPAQFPLQVTGLEDRLPAIKAPLLGLFGNDDSYPSPAEVDTLDRILSESDKPHEFHRYDGAGHAFLNVDRAAYRPAAAVDGWQRIAHFYGRYLS